MIEMQEKDIIELIESGEKVLLDFYTTNCSVCKMITPHLEQVENEVEIAIIKVNAEEMTSLAYNYEIMKVPQLILVEGGKEVKRHMGFLPKDGIKELINE